MRTLPAAAAALCLFVLVLRVLVLRVRRLRALVDALLELVDRASEGARQLGQLAPAEQYEPDDENDDELLTPQSQHGRPPPREGIRVRREPDERYARGGARGARRSARTPAGGESCGSGHAGARSEEHTSELQSRLHLVCRLLLEKKKKKRRKNRTKKIKM